MKAYRKNRQIQTRQLIRYPVDDSHWLKNKIDPMERTDATKRTETTERTEKTMEGTEETMERRKKTMELRKKTTERINKVAMERPRKRQKE